MYRCNTNMEIFVVAQKYQLVFVLQGGESGILGLCYTKKIEFLLKLWKQMLLSKNHQMQNNTPQKMYAN